MTKRSNKAQIMDRKVIFSEVQLIVHIIMRKAWNFEHCGKQSVLPYGFGEFKPSHIGISLVS